MSLLSALKRPNTCPSYREIDKKKYIRAKFETLLSTATTHSSAKYVPTVAKDTSWDLALDHGVSGTRGFQTQLKVLSHRIYKDSPCPSRGTSLCANSLWIDHIMSCTP